MNFNKFAETVESMEKPVILLEGSRNVLEDDAASLTGLAVKLSEEFPNATFRSGGAAGSDQLFAQGVLQINQNSMQLVETQAGKPDPVKTNEFFFDALPKSEQEEIFELTVQATPSYKGLVDFYKKKQKSRLYYKTQFLLRDALKVCGSPAFQIKRADLGCFYVNSDKPGGGGTGHTMRVCRLLNVPVIEQTEWMSWL